MKTEECEILEWDMEPTKIYDVKTWLTSNYITHIAQYLAK